MENTHNALLGMLLPAGLLDYFDLVKIDQKDEDLDLYLEEKNLVPAGFENVKLESKGFMHEIAVQDFPIRNNRVMLFIKRRRWMVLETGKIIKRDWDIVQKGTRITKDLGAFFKRITSIPSQLVPVSWGVSLRWMAKCFRFGTRTT